jgi:hypothetical protein
MSEDLWNLASDTGDFQVWEKYIDTLPCKKVKLQMALTRILPKSTHYKSSKVHLTLW